MSTKIRPRAESKGSEWRKWDLHVHTPGTRLNDQYKIDGKTVKHSEEHAVRIWNRYCKLIHESDVQVIGITDYFTFDSYFTFREEYRKRYPECDKVFFPNLELRLPTSLNKSGQHVNLHLLFPDTLDNEHVESFLRNLELTKSSQRGTKKLTAWDTRELEGCEVEALSVELDSCVQAIINTFDGIQKNNLHDACLLIASGRKDGLSTGSQNPSPRNEALLVETDRAVHGIFSRPKDREYWLDSAKRSKKAKRELASHPTFGGCDAHSFEDLENGLGKTITPEGGRHYHTTWIKATRTWNGLQQTLVEPESRVALQDLSPDSKKDYLVIDSVEFQSSGQFPEKIKLNSGLNTIIGSRSSGKSSLLSHIAYAISPDRTIEIQKKKDMKPPGPAAGYSWDDIAEGFCKVNWRSGGQGQAHLVYVPQNFLNELSSQPDQVNEYILPAVQKGSKDLYDAHTEDEEKIKSLCSDVDVLVGRWFACWGSICDIDTEINKFPKDEALAQQKTKYEEEIIEISKSTNLTEDDLNTSKAIQGKIDSLSEQIERAEKAENIARTLISSSSEGEEKAFDANLLKLSVDFQGLDSFVADQEFSSLTHKVDEARASLQRQLGQAVDELIHTQSELVHNSKCEREKLSTANEALFNRVKKISSIDEKREAIAEIEQKQKQLTEKHEQRRMEEASLNELADEIGRTIKERFTVEENAVDRFESEKIELEGKVEISLESQFSAERLESISEGVAKRGNKDILDENDHVNVKTIQGNPKKFLEKIAKGEVTLLRKADREMVSKSILKASPEFRFVAKMDEDTIGGFKQSTMTPGKQALFALTLILGDSGEAWPLLIDQPEDDLDSKSIYSEIVVFLKQQKKRRQIIMVTHNANLVVGADAELVLVANRHGVDRPNEGEQTFDYLSGALEDSKTDPQAKYELDKLGIREHVVEILDGGKEAFQKRQQKYKL